ncbi:acetyl-CoA hydrolase/transferase family protein [Neptunitalea lumnitzerae]|uniref:4-hydroxybutyrate CoA-transferase n=1 Tax=Neptunitalea lumnitzerae TaxID=2965509 RepID=A0ABQ5MIV1_9FLAO|nr:acetyl-CoA hydrolase/transferase C-terminal domain-containing protein [Neptunitalea sp. Y10]GLB49318.1 4-hydroxybutyrate CoA-transferase [Neptunitalea sp. Y10]
MRNYSTPEEAVKLIKSGDRVLVQAAAATPQTLLKAMVGRASELRDVEIVHIHTEGYIDYVLPEYADSFKTSCFFMGGNIRKAVQQGHAQYNPVFLSDIPHLFRSGNLPIDVALVNVSPPDKHGYCSLGVSVDIMIGGLESAKTVIAQINPNVPRTMGDGIIHIDKFDACVEVNDPLYELIPGAPTDEEQLIGTHIANMIEDGSTLQMGIGGIPNAVLSCLGNHKDLGVHTEMFSEGILPLIEKGVVNGSKKTVLPYKIVSGFAMGSKKLYDFMDDNPEVWMMDIAFVNDTAVIRQNPKAIAINSAIEVDITGQICADSIGTRMYSGVGGQMDFMRGAALSPGGKAICALPSITHKGVSKIVPVLKSGAGVVTTRAHVQYVVTEFGVAELKGRNLAQRAKALIDVAHPDAREELDREAHERFGNSFVSFNQLELNH